MGIKTWAHTITEAKSAGEGEEYEFSNAYPLAGPEHTLHPDCWCSPTVEWVESHKAVVIHNLKSFEVVGGIDGHK